MAEILPVRCDACAWAAGASRERWVQSWRECCAAAGALRLGTGDPFLAHRRQHIQHVLDGMAATPAARALAPEAAAEVLRVALVHGLAVALGAS